MDEQEQLTAFRKSFVELDQWRLRGRQTFVPASGGDLYEDDLDWPWLPVSQLAFVGLQAATDHMLALRCHIEARQLFPFADQTLCRSALVGAAEAVWVLAPDERAERLKRARTLAAYTLKHHSQYLTALRVSIGEPTHENTDLVAERVELRKSELETKRATDRQHGRLDTTAMINTAAASAFAPRFAKEVNLEWQAKSGAAHGLAWSILGTVDTQQGQADEAGMTDIYAAGSLARIANCYFAALHLARHGWALLDKRNAPDSANDS
ncbi:hypothetical protein ACXYX3_27635 (plasmid) [Mycobacterium sp. C3-094]